MRSINAFARAPLFNEPAFIHDCFLPLDHVFPVPPVGQFDVPSISARLQRRPARTCSNWPGLHFPRSLKAWLREAPRLPILMGKEWECRKRGGMRAAAEERSVAAGETSMEVWDLLATFYAAQPCPRNRAPERARRFSCRRGWRDMPCRRQAPTREGGNDVPSHISNRLPGPE